MSTFIYKPGTSKGPVFLAPDQGTREAPTITDSSGKVYNSRYLNTNEGRHQFVFDPGVTGLQGAKLNYGGQSTTLGNGSQSYEGAGLDSLQARSKGTIGGGGGGASNVPGANGGGSTLGSANPFFDPNFPSFQNVTPNPVNFPSIKTAPYQPIDVTKFGEDFAKSNLALFGQNFDSAQGFALKALDTELQGLKNFSPGAANLSRSEISKDNPFNQGERTAQLDATLPGLRNSLAGQTDRANTYANGQLTDPALDRAYELGIRSNAADAGTYAGFGSGSGQSSKISDLMSADERFKISQYGEGLLDQNAGVRANIELAPTEYSNAGSQIKAVPEVGAGRLTYQGAGMINEATLLSPGQALGTAVQQSQFATSLEENNRQFDATGTFDASKFNSSQALQADEFNSEGQFTAALGKFGYDTSYLNALQTANQGALNNATGASVAGINAGTFNAGLGAGQVANTISGGLQGIGAIDGVTEAVSNILGTTGTTSSAPQAGTVPSGASVGGASSQPAPSASAAPAGVDLGSGQGTVTVAPAGDSIGPDSSIPLAQKFSSASQVPSGYSAVSSNNDGSVSAVPTSAYEPAIQQMAKFANIPSGSVDIGSIAAADKSLSSAAALSFQPLPGFRPVALTATGGSVYSLPAAASSGDITKGRDAVQSAGLTLAHLGISDPKMYEALAHTADIAGDSTLHAQLDKLSVKEGPEAVAQAIVDNVKHLGANSKTKAGQQVLAGAMRLGQVWDNLSPAQKSLGLSSLANPLMETHSGRSPGAQVVPGTEKSIAGPLTVGDVMSFSSKGANGLSLARNWNDVSAITAIASGASTPREVASVAGKIGLTGFGPSGSAVPVSVKQLAESRGSAAPQFGVGALRFPNTKAVPGSYQLVTKAPGGEVIAVPRNLSSTTPFSKDSVSPLVYKKSQEIAAGVHPAQKLWGKNPAGRVVKNSVGGSAVVSGLDVMHKTNPTLFSAVAAHAFFNNLIEREAA